MQRFGDQKTKQLKYWEGKFGEEYIKRNSDIQVFLKRKTFFTNILKKYKDIRSILEVGCNIGGNLYTINQINDKYNLCGIEPNKKAYEMAKKLYPYASFLKTNVFELSSKIKYDLVFTSGVLIHISNKDLEQALKKIYKVSNKYILTIEYYSKFRKVIPYRNLTDALFKRPYDKEWLNIFPNIQIIEKGYLDNRNGFDRSNWWLFKK